MWLANLSKSLILLGNHGTSQEREKTDTLRLVTDTSIAESEDKYRFHLESKYADQQLSLADAMKSAADFIFLYSQHL
ncbi:hypothetical protein EB796_020461 [Bugula neritina]|uniref:Uncharacterized protein n=1 Tax=Bugula neritina TaxID=10212 RepID=A0A7J7J5S5_BUGNE|nr:hypothetical protein EB796_020461 [Bugula neritina]